MTYLGVDPGFGGAVAVLTVHPEGRQTVVATPTPVAWLRTTTGKVVNGRGRCARRRRYDVPAMLTLLRELPPIALAYLELQGARPGQGRASIFTTGLGQGLWEGLLVAAGIPFRIVPPPTWRKALGLRGADKHAVVLVAARRFPAIPLRAEHADAVMLAVAAAVEHGVDPRRRTSGEALPR